MEGEGEEGRERSLIQMEKKRDSMDREVRGQQAEMVKEDSEQWSKRPGTGRE